MVLVLEDRGNNGQGLTVSVKPVDAVAARDVRAGLETVVKRPFLVGDRAPVFSAILGVTPSRQPARHAVAGAADLHDLAVESWAKRFVSARLAKGAVLRERTLIGRV